MRFLIIDDSPHDRELIKRTIQKELPESSYIEVIHQQAFNEAIRTLDYSIVFTDYQLKWTTGLNVLKAIRACSTEVPVIMVTDTGCEEVAAEAMKMGLNDYVLKTHLSRLPIAIRECLERARLQAEQRDLQAQMLQAQKMESLGLLVSGIAHDFNNLLAAIAGLAQLAMIRTEQEATLSHGYFQDIYHRADQGKRMTRQLLAFARGVPIEPKPLDLNQQIASHLDFLRTLVGSSVQLDFHPAPVLDTVNADATQLEQVLVNLCLNARDAMPMGGHLELATQQVEITHGSRHGPPYLSPGSYVLLRVKDNGIGMDEQVQARMFEPFFTTKDVGTGTGLGLSVVYGFVKQHHGIIQVQSQPDKGSTFLLYFPVIEQQVEVEKEEKPPAEQATEGGGETILLVEDDPSIQFVMSEVLEDCGYRVLAARDGEEGLRIFEAHTPEIALVVADIMMPKMKGRQFQEHVHRQHADTKVLVISGYSEVELKQQGLLDATSAFLQKPFNLDLFVVKVHELLN